MIIKRTDAPKKKPKIKRKLENTIFWRVRHAGVGLDCDGIWVKSCSWFISNPDLDKSFFAFNLIFKRICTILVPPAPQPSFITRSVKHVLPRTFGKTWLPCLNLCLTLQSRHEQNLRKLIGTTLWPQRKWTSVKNSKFLAFATCNGVYIANYKFV